MRDRRNIDEVATLAPDYMGFIFYRESPRYVGNDFDAAASLPAGITGVGVFVNESVELMLQTLARNKLKWVQLHGQETPEVAQELKSKGITVIKVFSVDEDFDFDDATPYKKYADFFLFDTKGKLFGGNARRWNWSKLKQYDQEKPFFLSGGIDAENIDEVASLSGMNIHGIDINSGVEITPAIKDRSKVETIKRKIHDVLGA